MPDWNGLVRERMESLGLSPAEKEDIVSELANHLEDCCEELRAQGHCKSEAIERSLEQVADWPSLSRKIRRAKRKAEMMNNRTKTFWIPGLVGLAASMGWILVLQ